VKAKPDKKALGGREACLRTALHQLRDIGPERLSLREVARDAGVSPGAPYRHFPNREALLAALAERAFRSFSDFLLEACPRGVHLITLDEFREMGRQYIRFAMRNPESYRLMFTSIVREHRDYPELWTANRESFLILVTAVEVLQRLAALRTAPSIVVAAHVYATYHGFVSLYLEQRIDDTARSVEAIVQRFEPHFDLLLKGIGKRA